MPPLKSRDDFVVAVYSLLILQTFLTVAVLIILLKDSRLMEFAMRNYLYWLILDVLFLVALNYSSRFSPWNYVFLSGFCLMEGIMFAQITVFYPIEMIFISLGLTNVLFGLLTAFAYKTALDFTAVYNSRLYLFAALFFMGILTNVLQSSRLDAVSAFLGIIIFCTIILFDTQMIIGKTHQFAIFSQQDFVLVSVQVYMDVFVLFFQLLRFLGHTGLGGSFIVFSTPAIIFGNLWLLFKPYIQGL